jgi:ABC-type multidrug transport system ATPase subunit
VLRFAWSFWCWKNYNFQCLTGEEIPSSGRVRVNGFDVTTSSGFNQARSLIGYCLSLMQYLVSLLLEHLLYAIIKGILAEYRERIIEKQIEEMDLRDFENVKAE